jgi:hypothetical protein
MAALLSLSQRQARLFVQTLVDFDGHTSTTATRFFSSRDYVVSAFEVAAVLAGFSVSPRRTRQPDIGKANHCITISERNEISVSRVGDGGAEPMVQKPNATSQVWCVTVPTHKIVVRRHGFSFVCCQCAEADSLRTAFPTMLGGLYLREEIDLFSGSQPTTSAQPPAFIGPPTDVPQGTSETQSHTQEPSDTPETPPKTVQEPSEPPMGSLPTPEPSDASEGDSRVPASTLATFVDVPAAVADGLSGDALLGKVQETIAAAGLKGDQLTKWAHQSMMLKANQLSWSDMSEAKLRNVLKKFGSIGPAVAKL